MRTAILIACVTLSVGVIGDFVCAEPTDSNLMSIAVFEFELEDVSPAGAQGKVTTSPVSLRRATVAARKQLEKSGRYRIVKVDEAINKDKADMLRHCDGCEAEIAHKLGAQQSLFGVVRRATQTDYYIVVKVRDAGTGRLLNAQAANFAGGEEGWPHGVRMILKHQILAR